MIQVSTGQSFEGKLTYKVDFEINEERLGEMGVTKEMIVDKMKKEGEYYDKIIYRFKEGNYVKEDNSSNKKRFVYKSLENKIYLFEDESEYVTIMKGENPSLINQKSESSSIRVHQIDSIKIIKNDTCKLVKLTWGNLSEEYHWYNPSKIIIDYNLFQRHNYEYLNKILEITKAFPFEITKSVGKFMTITMTVDEIEELDVEENIFAIPELKKSKRKGDKYFERVTGNIIMKIKN